MENRDLTAEPVAAGKGAGEPRLRLQSIGAGYGSKQVVFDIDLEVRAAQIVVLLGHNGAGKSTVMSAAFGLLPLRGGSVFLGDRNASSMSPRDRVSGGMSYVPADNFVFPDLTVSENLALGGLTERDARKRRERREWALSTWPILAERQGQEAGTLSGGQRRMLSLATALMSSPSLLLLDEPSLGLAPNIVDNFFGDLRRLADEEGMAVLLIEQSVAKALDIADDAYVMRAGRMQTHADPAELRGRDSLWDLF